MGDVYEFRLLLSDQFYSLSDPSAAKMPPMYSTAADFDVNVFDLFQSPFASVAIVP